MRWPSGYQGAGENGFPKSNATWMLYADFVATYPVRPRMLYKGGYC